MYRSANTVRVVVVAAVLVPLLLAANSPLLEWRDPVYIVAGFAGVIAMVLLLLQPMLATGQIPGIGRIQCRRAHRFIGVALVLSIIVHVAGLWLTSPPDVIDALLFNSATPFSVWGVIAMWGVFFTSVLAATRKKVFMTLYTWKIAHRTLAVVIVAGTVIHAILIEGTMETVSKYALCVLLLWVTFMAIVKPGR
ncbi:ferric reductase [Chromatiales bacterium (ex Bugula neritina AB1)]|nr:ferric reductase [Chromatiales bacterium (ex Bugula neritina AB1)]